MHNRGWIVCISLLLLLSLLQVEGGYWVSSSSSSRSIDDIITEEWDRLVSLGKVNTVNTAASNDNQKITPNSHKHNHDHKACASDEWMERRMSSLKPLTVSTDENTPYEEPAHSNHKRAGQTMRFYVDDTVLTSGTDPQACYTVGSTIYFDANTATPHTCLAEDILSAGLIDLINNSLMPTMLQIFSEVLSVKTAQVLNPLKLDSTTWNSFGQECDTNVPIPASYVNTGLSNTDYIIFITARPTASTGTVAYAGGCNFKQISSGRYSRPYAGILNLNPRYFQSYVTSMTLFDYKSALKTAMHETTHALGFSNYFYNSFLDNTTSTYYSPAISFSSTSSGTSPAGNAYSQTIQKIRSPNVLRFARDYFNCPTLDGVELEEYGGSGTAGSHWDRRVCGEEYMTGFVSDQMWISGFTLSFFADMGWYDVDRSKVEYLGWGKDAGCAFVQSRCETSWPSAGPGYWCTSTSAITGCTGDRVGYGQCYLAVSSQPLAAYYQHFSNAAQGGFDVAADSCPYMYPFTSCRDTTRTAKASYFEVYSENSRCWEVQSGASTTLVCYPFQCITNNTVLQVQINSNWVTCPTSGGTVSVSSILGGTTTVNCPKTSLFCRVVDGFQPQVLITDAMLASPGATSPSVTPSITPSRTATPSITPTRTPSVSPTRTPTPSVTPSRTPSSSPSRSPTPSVTPSVTRTPSITPSITPSPTSSPSVGASQSSTPSRTPSTSVSSSVTPSRSPSSSPTRTPSASPSSSPSAGSSQSSTPSRTPSTSPSPSTGALPSSSPSAGSAASVSSSPGAAISPSKSPAAGKGGKKKLLEGNNIVIIGAAGGGAVLLLTGAAVAVVLVRRRKNAYKPSYYNDGSTAPGATGPTDVALQPIPVVATSDIQRNMMAQPGGPPAVPSNPKPPVPNSNSNPFPVNSECKAKYTGDGQFYTAVVVQFNPQKGYLVRYPEYGEEEWLPASSLRKK